MIQRPTLGLGLDVVDVDFQPTVDEGLLVPRCAASARALQKLSVNSEPDVLLHTKFRSLIEE